MSLPNLLFGAALIGDSHKTEEEVKGLLDQVQSLGISRIDTAARYPKTDPGASERLLGLSGAVQRGFTLDTKVNLTGDGSGSLKPAAIEKSVVQSCKSLGVDKVFIILSGF